MKRLFSICLLSLACTLLASAQVAFLEYKSSASMTNGADYSEKAAYDWFVETYGSDNVVDMSHIPSDASTYKVLWINIDDNGSGDLPAALLDVKTAIETYVKAGGNLLLTKRAARIATEIGRLTRTTSVKYYPDDSEYNDPVRNYVNARLGTSVQERNASKHPIFDNVPLNNSEEGHYLLSSTTPGKSYIWTEMERVDGVARAANNTINHLNEFQDGWNCQVLAVWGNVTDFCGPVIVEFFPKGDYKGSIISIGTRSYVWGSNNSSNLANVKKLTSNALNYLAAGGNTYGYVMPYTLSELYSLSGDDGTYKPDYEAAKWFYDNYIVTNKGRFIHKEEAIPTGMKVLWVNNDRVGQESDALKTAFGGDNFRDTLSAFVEAGGNVFLSKQATRFIGDIGRVRADWWPSYGESTEGPADGTWYMVDNFVAVDKEHGGVDLHNHPVYATLRATKADQYTEHKWMDGSVEKNEGYCKWPLFAGEGNTTKMTYIWGEPTEVWSNTYSITHNTLSKDRLIAFEDSMQCKILGGWGHTTALDAVGFAEFPPATIDEKTFGGSVICIGLPAYQWSVENTYIGNVRALTQGILDYLGGVVVVTEPETDLTSTTVNDLVVYQGGSVSNTEDIVVTNSITYIRPVVGGSASNELGHWYTFCLPFTPTKCYIYDETDKADYEINSVYLTGSDVDTNSPEGEGSFYLQTFPRDADNNWTYIDNNGIPSKNKPYIIKFLNASEDGGKGAAWATYFTSNPTVKFKGGAQTVTGTDDGTGGDANGDYSYHVNKTLHKITLSNVYTLNTAENYFEYDYGGTSVIMPFECYIKASSPVKALARPRIAIGPNKTQEETNTATDVESVYIDSLMPVAVYDLMGRMFYSGQMPETLPQGVWIIRQGSNSFKLINR